MTVVGILGGTGPLGRGLARWFAVAGHEVVLGSRDPERGTAAAGGLGPRVTGGSHRRAAAADLVVVAVPYAGHATLLTELAEPLSGKVVIDCVSPLGFDSRGPYALPVPDGSAAQEAQRLLPGSTVVGAFHHISAVVLLDPATTELEGDILVVTEDRAAGTTVIELVASLPRLRGVYAGRLRNAGQVEALTANLIAINRRYSAHAGLQITGLS
ncbi:MAG: NADPH-dependent F420 reductase [Actinomycetes bacterium]